MELCNCEQRQKKIRPIEIDQIRNFTTLEPYKRFDKIQEWAKNSRTEEDPVLKEFKISVDLKAPLDVTGRVIPPPDIEYADQRLIDSQSARLGSWNHQNYKFFKTINLQKWIVLDLRQNQCNISSLIEYIINGKFLINFYLNIQ